MEIFIRPENEEDYYIVENLTREAFWKPDKKPIGCDEHYLLNKLRQSSDFIKELDYVALADNKIVGHIIYTKSRIIDSDNNEHETISFGPISVLPEYQKKGIGTKLINFTFKKAKEMGYRAVIIYGHPEYYPRFGFKNAKDYNITTPEGKNFDAFMICELFEGALNGITGRGYESSIFFDINAQDAEEFDKRFPLMPSGKA